MFQTFEDVSDHSQSAQRIAALRKEMERHQIDGYLIPRSDEYQGEYVAPYAERLRWLMGFTGSAGLAIVLADRAVIFVDGRYTIQVREQVDLSIVEPLHLVDQPPAEWLRDTVRAGQRIGFDPWLLTVDQRERFAKACQAAGAQLVPVADNLVDTIWIDKPARPTGLISLQPTQLAGRSAAEKRADLIAALGRIGADAVVLTQPDSIAWAFNIRGSDIAHTPVPLAFAIVSTRGLPQLFIEPGKIDDDTRAALEPVCELRSPETFSEALRALGKQGGKVSIDPAWAATEIREQLVEAGAKVINSGDPCILPKARKNAVELEGARVAHRRDAVAMARFLAWLDRRAGEGGLDEIAAAQALERFRVETGELREISFDTISAAGPHAAIPHYRVSTASNLRLENNSIYLVDSGAQYPEGTTDITRTIIVGTPNAEMRDRFTRVLKGMIAITNLRFPEKTTGAQIDAFARLSLWQAGLDFDHGTGHGVGSYLSVHEGPARISKAGTVALETGMILSNEPGYYKAGQYGIRIENLLVVRAPEPVPGGERAMHSFETLTFVPIDRRLIDIALLDEGEIRWIDDYHARVWSMVEPSLDGETREWLRQATAPLR